MRIWHFSSSVRSTDSQGRITSSCGCKGCSESSLGAHVILQVLLCPYVRYIDTLGGLEKKNPKKQQH